MRDLQQRGPYAELTDHPLVQAARDLSQDLLAGVGGRWNHTQGVARRAVDAAAAVPEEDRPVLVAAAWLHDVGYAAPLRRTGFHPLDGACYLQEHSWPDPVPGLVAHHSAARFVAAARGLSAQLAAFPATRYADGPLADALTYADQTTGPDGQDLPVDARLADMLRRHGPHSPNARVHEQREPAVRAAVRRTEQRLRGC
jgi:hypothetical protein